ncbi:MULTISPECIES: 50S ribosomal protein L1 [Bifidobacterium]|jgi:large subunit ribosomal protein L1|uniref:Large ribosomal subunit protein uL1 n=4 Tax=Bifidobacterium TaxID=1678 RepID=A0A2N3QGY8_9BIFI|nr:MULTISPECIES: 50S ribosomal protein L1 [Bifidobacterium]KFI99215.1 50S ribosomal protein L1 [Bifidobacterium porcinum]AGH41792.1 50S ribosomal protein L1 [Bifidobacterium thermophilum RBL67]KAB8299578.1 50S ribosomal protein L1 [Bifidobacterium apri]MBM6981570.1 50S ribosomal protein L1 [Bifidobacterium thermophilum]MCI2175037.1 50S ribosomal protein L1 [Bifidobacterium thermacidophilum]
MAKKHSKKYREAAEKVDRNNLYTAPEAIALLKSMPKRGFDETIEAVYRLNVDPRKADQLVRGVVNLPNGTGKTAKVLVFARGPKATEATEAGADIVGDDDLVQKVQDGFLDFDAVVATPDMMGKVGRLGRILGPRGLMPNPKTGTVTMDVTKAVKDIKGGKIEFRVDKHGNLSFLIGKMSFEEKALDENFKAVADEIKRLKPSTVKGRYITKATITSTMGPGIPLDTATLA